MTLLRVWGISVAVAAGVWAQSGPKPSFEAASVKVSPPSPVRDNPILTGDAGRLEGHNVTLREIIREAYQIKEYQVSGPDWIGTQRFDLVAKIPDGTPVPQKWEMLRTLLVERFGLEVHREQKDLPVYSLAVAKDGPKMKEFAESEQPDELHMGFGTLKGQGISVPALTDFLCRLMDRPVVDQTGLTSQYDVALRWTPEPGDGSLVGMKIGMARAGGGDVKLPDASGPPLTLAVQQQLGLRLEPKKMPVDVVIVDHAEKVPTEN